MLHLHVHLTYNISRLQTVSLTTPRTTRKQFVAAQYTVPVQAASERAWRRSRRPALQMEACRLMPSTRAGHGKRASVDHQFSSVAEK